jgi:chemotaxis protein CheD
VIASTAARRVDSRDAGNSTSGTGRRFFDTASGLWMVKVFPGEYYVTRKTDEMLVTILGSCVSACIRDPHAGIGGMNHFMLAEGAENGWGEDLRSTRYGNFAMEKLINELIKAGCRRESLEIKVFGGGNVTDARNLIGTQNATFVRKYLSNEGLRWVAEDLGGPYPRRIQYNPQTGRVVRKLLNRTESAGIVREETQYASTLSKQKTTGEVELFE